MTDADARDAALETEAERLRDYIDAQRADNERLQVDLYGARAALETSRAEGDRLIELNAALEEQNAALRAQVKRDEGAFETIRLNLVKELHEPARSAFWGAVEARDKARAALAQSGGGEVGDE